VLFDNFKLIYILLSFLHKFFKLFLGMLPPTDSHYCHGLLHYCTAMLCYTARPMIGGREKEKDWLGEGGWGQARTVDPIMSTPRPLEPMTSGSRGLRSRSLTTWTLVGNSIDVHLEYGYMPVSDSDNIIWFIQQWYPDWQRLAKISMGQR
jgi:hypothetical protein